MGADNDADGASDLRLHHPLAVADRCVPCKHRRFLPAYGLAGVVIQRWWSTHTGGMGTLRQGLDVS